MMKSSKNLSVATLFIISLVFASINLSCGESSDSENDAQTIVGNPDDTGIKVTEVTPTDSTGETGQVDVSFGASASGLSLTQDLGNGIELTAAKFSIAAIKFKANKELNPDELLLEAEELATEKEELDELEDTADEETSLALNAGNGKSADKGQGGNTDNKQGGDTDNKKDEAATNKGQKVEKEERRANLAKSKADLKAKSEERAKKDVEKDSSIKFAGPYIFDALTGELSEELTPVDMVDGSYERMEFKLRRNWDVEDDDPLLGNVFIIHGNYTNGDTTTAFEIDYHIAMNFRLKGDGSFAVLPGETNTNTVLFDLSTWFEGVDLSTATADEDSGVIYINNKSNSDIFRGIRKNIKEAIRFGKDKDGDGSLDASETAGEGEDTEDEIEEDEEASEDDDSEDDDSEDGE